MHNVIEQARHSHAPADQSPIGIRDGDDSKRQKKKRA